MRARCLLPSMAILVVMSLGLGAVENVGGLFDIGVSGRALGLGGAFTALSDDEGAVFHNPAGMSWYTGIGLSSLFVRQFGGVSYGSITLAVPYAGLALSFLDSGAIATTDGATRYASQGVVAGVGVSVGPLGIGTRLRVFRLSSPTSGLGWSIDPAILVAAKGVRVGLLYEGAFASPVEYESGTKEDWPQSLRLGAAVTLAPVQGVHWSAAFEAAGLFSGLARLAFGVETWIGGLGARVGYDGTGPTFGLSLRFSTLQFDWAYASRDDLGDSHRISLSLRF